MLDDVVSQSVTSSVTNLRIVCDRHPVQAPHPVECLASFGSTSGNLPSAGDTKENRENAVPRSITTKKSGSRLGLQIFVLVPGRGGMSSQQHSALIISLKRQRRLRTDPFLSRLQSGQSHMQRRRLCNLFTEPHPVSAERVQASPGHVASLRPNPSYLHELSLFAHFHCSRSQSHNVAGDLGIIKWAVPPVQAGSTVAPWSQCLRSRFWCSLFRDWGMADTARLVKDPSMSSSPRSDTGFHLHPEHSPILWNLRVDLYRCTER
ncbi:hypothetical protein C8J56DRAFT_1037318 [Mycena floridula]|nr:hypothetical protein C8J56DRAFT_1037318 [Mycena floridula]